MLADDHTLIIGVGDDCSDYRHSVTETSLTVTVVVTRVASPGRFCKGGMTSLRIHLVEPLGDREVYDGIHGTPRRVRHRTTA